MKFLKNIYSCFFSCILALYACDRYEPMDQITDVSWYTSETIKQGDVYKVKIDSCISFMDLSQGCLSHEWILEDGSVFMKDDFNIKDGNFQSHTAPEKGDRSSNPTESVLFGKQGMTKVILRDVFPEFVKSNTLVPVESIKEGENWILTKEFPIDVFGKLNPSVSIRKTDGTEVLNLPEGYEIPKDKVEWATIELQSGDKLIFVDNLGGDRPDTRTWMLAGKTFDGKEVEFRFPNAVEYSNFTITSKRELPLEAVNKIIPLKVMVKPTTAPFCIDSQASSLDPQNPSVIRLQASNGEFDKFIGAEGAFNVQITAVDGTLINDIHVKSVSINDNDKAVLLLTLSERLYAEEKISLTYCSESGLIKAADGRPLQSFEKVAIKNEYKGVSVVPEDARKGNGFELPYRGHYWTDKVCFPFFSLSTEQAYEGEYSLKVNISSALPKLAFYMQSKPIYYSIKPGTYKLVHYIYVESGADQLAGRKYGIKYMDANKDHFKDGAPQYFRFPAESGKWIMNSMIVTYTKADLVGGKIGYKFEFPKDTPAGSVFYLDSIDLFEMR